MFSGDFNYRGLVLTLRKYGYGPDEGFLTYFMLFVLDMTVLFVISLLFAWILSLLGLDMVKFMGPNHRFWFFILVGLVALSFKLHKAWDKDGR